MKKKYRVKSASDFQNVITNGKKLYSNEYIIYYLNTDKGFNRVGISVGKKILKLAVDRNYEKRVLREIISDIYGKLTGSYDFIIIMRKNAIGLTYDQKQAKIIALLQSKQLLEVINEI